MNRGKGSRGLWRRVPVTLALMIMVALLALGAQPRGTVAQGTPEASPTSGPCEAPDLPDGTPAPDAPEEAASPVVEETAAADDATAVVEETAEPAGTPADTVMAESVTTAVQNFANCWNEENWRAVAALGTPDFWQSYVGQENRYNALAELEDWGQYSGKYTLESAENAEQQADGRVSIEGTYLRGDHFYSAARWYFVDEDGRLLLDEIELLVPELEGDTVLVGLTVDPTADPYLVWGQASIVQQAVVTVHVVNSDTVDHNVVIRRLSDDDAAAVEAATPVSGDATESAEFVAASHVEPGEQLDLYLVNLEPGTFVAYDGVDEDVVATITVAEPAA